MRGRNTVILNGQAYDALSGLPLTGTAHAPKAAPRTEAVRPAPAAAGKIISDFGPVRQKLTVKSLAVQPIVPTATRPVQAGTQNRPPLRNAATIHRIRGKSHTLNRQALKKPEFIRVQAAVAATRSPLISKFGNHFTPPAAHALSVSPAKAKADVHGTDRQPHRIVAAHAAVAPAAATIAAPLSGSLLKEQLIRERLNEAQPANQASRQTKTKPGLRGLLKFRPRSNSLAVMIAGLLLFGGYLAYVNLPNLSVRVASARAGVNASYPQYSPDGYRFAGPVAYAPGEVTIRFKSNTNTQSYKIVQRASSWDSQAVLDNLVTKESNSYLTYSEQGLTVYTFNNKAAWVNGGVLYVVSGDAPLSSDQLLRIAASM